MSNALAIAAVTATLRRILLDAGIEFVTTLPLDKAATAQQAERVNLLLYQVVPNAAWRNQLMPGRFKPGEQGFPPLALNLQYLITAYGSDDSSLLDNRLIGRALLALHDHPVLDPADIQSATDDIKDKFLDTVPDLHQQVERVKLTLQVMNMEELSKLWSTFQTQYRISVPFEASVVLIESGRPSKTPLPVTQRGKDDQGWETQASLGPILDRVDYVDPLVLRARPFSAASFPHAGEPNRVCSFSGTDLPTSGVRILIQDTRQPVSTQLVAALQPLSGSTKERIRFEIDPALPGARWVSGPLSICLEYKGQNGKLRSTDSLLFALAPRLKLTPSGKVLAIPSDLEGKSLLTVGCDPPLVSDAATLLLDSENGESRQAKVFPNSTSHSASTPTFDVTGIPPGVYRIRLRIELVDSLTVKRSTSDPSRIEPDNSQQIQL